MAYLAEFHRYLENRDPQGFMNLWEEYCAGDEVDAQEVVSILKAINASDFAPSFGKHISTVLDLWKQVKDKEESYQVFKALIDLQNTNSPELADLTLQILQERFGAVGQFNEKIRIVGLKNRTNFQGAVSNFELLSHMAKGKFVFHTGGWGTGEIIDISAIREQLTLEFEMLTGKRDLSFASAFKNLIPLRDDHFLSRRFGNPDELEEEARKDPVAIIRLLLQDLGPKTASEIKDELCDLVIPEGDWTKWWQNTRAKLKKDTFIETPENIKDTFKIRSKELSHDDRVLNALEKETNEDKVVETIYSYIRDYPEVLKTSQTKKTIHERILECFKDPKLTDAQKIQCYILLQDIGEIEYTKILKDCISSIENIADVIKAIQIGAHKKRALLVVRETKDNWVELFTNLLFELPIHTLREYILKELNQGASKKNLEERMKFLLDHPTKQPDLFVWYFQKATEDKTLPFSDKQGLCNFLESFLLLLSQIEQLNHYRDLVKKMLGMITEGRFALVRAIIEGTSIEYLKEFLLLVTKCTSLSDHDRKIMHSLAQVVQPSLGKKEKDPEESFEIIWTTKEGFQKTQARIQQIGTVETVENAKEIEAARALGDLRENSEYKFALEKRSRLQGELAFLTRQLNKARIITEIDIAKNEVGVGSKVTVKNSKGDKITYTLLGPWDADPDNNILSLQSKFALSMMGIKKGERFKFQDEEYEVVDIKSYLE
jgi:transcription elongation factor GreA-like protein/transcription elongation GreA/GreB family factor